MEDKLKGFAARVTTQLRPHRLLAAQSWYCSLETTLKHGFQMAGSSTEATSTELLFANQLVLNEQVDTYSGPQQRSS